MAPEAMDTSTNDRPSTSDELLNCNFADYAIKYEFRVLSQCVKVCNLNTLNESFTVFTEIQMFSMKSNVKEIHLSLGQFCYLPNEELGPKGLQITVQGFPAEYSRNNLRLKEISQNERKNLRNLKTNIKKAHEKFKGGLSIRIPRECEKDISENRVISVRIGVNVVKPKFGVKFDFKVDKLNNQVPGGHVFTYRSSVFSSTREWLPCFDMIDQLALWVIELEVPEYYTAIGCGDLLRTSFNETRKLKSFTYQLKIPTAAANIGFVIGDLELYTLPDLPDVSTYTLPGLDQVLENTISSLPAILTFLEETLAGRFPYSSYRLAFIDNVPDEVISFAGLSVFSIHLLHHKRILDIVQNTRQIVTHGVACQFFGCLVNASDFADFWVVKAMARYVTSLYIERTFGLSEYVYQINRLMEIICDYEDKFGPITLRHRDESTHADLHFDPTCINTCPSSYAEMLYRKGQLIMRILELRLGKEQFLKVLQRVVVVALEYGGHTEKPIDWYHTVVSIDSFFNTVTNVTGRELPSFIDLFINNGGHTQFDVQYVPNRKRNTIEVEIRQDIKAKKGCRLYVGPLTMNIQELDGYYTHTVQIDSDVSKHDIQCHSKGRKQKKKKVPISTGEELEIDLSLMDPDSPIMWIRVDPMMQLIRRVSINQPAHQWEYMLRNERCIVAQLDAIESLLAYPMQQTQTALQDALQNDQFFYRVRSKAAVYLTEVCNRLPDGLIIQPTPCIAFFQNQYGCNSDKQIPVLNNFVATSSNLQNYFLMVDMPSAISQFKQDNICPEYVTKFLLGLLKYNDNSINRYSDDHYRAALISSLSNTLSHNEGFGPIRPESLNPVVEEIVFEVTRALNKDVTNPSYSRVVSSACLKTIRMLQKLNHLPLDTELFWMFAQSKSVFSPLRISAYSCLSLLVSLTRDANLIDNIAQLFDTMLNDINPYIRYALGNELITKPPFFYSKDVIECKSYPSNSEQMAKQLWMLITDLKMEPRLRSMFADIFYVMYSNETPFMFYSEAEKRRIEEEQHRENEAGTTLHKL